MVENIFVVAAVAVAVYAIRGYVVFRGCELNDGIKWE